MKLDLSLSGKQLAAGVVLLLGVVLALGSVIATGVAAGPVDAAAIAQRIVAQQDHITGPELAQWLIEKRTDFQLIDIRTPWRYDDYHIPTAINIPLADLFQPAGLKQLHRSKKIVVYGLGPGHSAQAQILLQLKGYNALSVVDGITGWWRDVMTPQGVWAEEETPQGYRQKRALRAHFMGGPAPAKASAAKPVAAPPPPAPATRKKKPSRIRLKLGRGCS